MSVGIVTMYSPPISERTQDQKRYGDLLQSLLPKKIETKQEYDFFIDLIEALLEKEESEDLLPDESDLVELLVVIVQDYETRTVSFSDSEPIDVLLHLMESNSLKQSDLVGILGSSGVVSEVVNGKREISKAQAQKLGDRFNLSYKLFL
jgi:HTH-type transcriptional regulator / antitoxin HigA